MQMTTKVTITADQLCHENMAVAVVVTNDGQKQKPKMLRAGESAEIYVYEGQSIEVSETLCFPNKGHDYGDYADEDKQAE